MWGLHRMIHVRGISTAVEAHCCEFDDVLGPRDQLEDLAKWLSFEVTVKSSHNHSLARFLPNVMQRNVSWCGLDF
jgi:hypothetical protein